jgi:hypothetical protein
MFHTNVVENIKTHILCSVHFSENRTIREKMWKNVAARQTADDTIIERMQIACRIPNATSTPSEYVMLPAFPRQQWLRERASILRYTCIACLVKISCWRLFSDTQHTNNCVITRSNVPEPGMLPRCVFMCYV